MIFIFLILQFGIVYPPPPPPIPLRIVLMSYHWKLFIAKPFMEAGGGGGGGVGGGNKIKNAAIV